MSNNKPQTFKENVLFRTTKILDMGYITILYFISAILVTIFLNKYFKKMFGDIVKGKSKSILYVSLEIILYMWLITIFVYLIRNIVPMIPSPFNNHNHYIHDQLKELNSAHIFIYILMTFQVDFVGRLRYLYSLLKQKNIV